MNNSSLNLTIQIVFCVLWGALVGNRKSNDIEQTACVGFYAQGQLLQYADILHRSYVFLN